MPQAARQVFADPVGGVLELFLQAHEPQRVEGVDLAHVASSDRTEEENSGTCTKGG